MQDIRELNGLGCKDSTGWPGRVQTTVGSTGAVSLLCNRLASVALNLSKTGSGTFEVKQYVPDGVDEIPTVYGTCGPAEPTCSINVPLGPRTRIAAMATSSGGTTQNWGGDCTGVGWLFYRFAGCVLTIDAEKSVSLEFVG